MYEQLKIANTIAAGPGPGNTDPRVLQQFASAGLADHMHPDVLNGMIECKHMLRAIWGTANTYTFGVAGTGWSGLDCMIAAVQPGDSVVVFVNGTFSGIDALSLRMKAATAEELAENPTDPVAASVNVITIDHGASVDGDTIEQALATHKPKWALMAHYETGSGRINDIQGFSAACLRHGVLGMVDAVSSLGVADFRIDDYLGVAAWASCPQKGISCLPLTYAPVSFRQDYIDALNQSGARCFVHHPLMEARHWGIMDGQDVEKGVYHRTHSAYAVAAFHEALRLTLAEGLANRAARYAACEDILRRAFTAMGCEVTSNMTSLVVLNLPPNMAGREMEFVTYCRSQNFGIWPTLSQPTQVRVGILNLLSNADINDIVTRFGAALVDLGGSYDVAEVDHIVGSLQASLAAE